MFSASSTTLAVNGISPSAMESAHSPERVLRELQQQHDDAENADIEDEDEGDVTIRPQDDDDIVRDSVGETAPGQLQQSLVAEIGVEMEMEEPTSSSRTMLGMKRRKRGARRKGGASTVSGAVPSTVSSPHLATTMPKRPLSSVLSTSPLQNSVSAPSGDPLDCLAHEAQMLARELSRQHPSGHSTSRSRSRKEEKRHVDMSSVPNLSMLPSPVTPVKAAPIPKKPSKWNVFSRKESHATTPSPSVPGSSVHKSGKKELGV